MIEHQIQLTDRTQQRIEQVARTELPQSIATLVDEYDDAIGERDRFLWRWLYHLFPTIKLSCVSADHERRVRDAKLVASMFVVILDDLGEVQMDRVTFEEGSKIPFEHQSVDYERDGVDGRQLRFATRVWEVLVELMEDAPRHGEFADLFAFDVRQNINAVDYSFTLNHHLEMGSVGETTTYDAHNMMLFTYANLDLMHSSEFDRVELGDLRKVVHNAQQMARIGNWITTWEREIGEGDFSSGVVVYALENGLVSPSTLYDVRENPTEERCERIIEAIRDHDVEGVFLDRWHRKRSEVVRLGSALDSVDAETYLEGMETVMSYHLASRGFK